MNEILQKRIIDKANAIIDFNLVDLNDLVNQHDLFKMLIEIAVFALQNQWISVEEALPEYEERVLVAHQHGCQVASLYKDGSHQYWGVAKDSPIGANITHWSQYHQLDTHPTTERR